ncbi:MAG TPA: ABC transporter permease [Vicinamibacterales bacterium]|jgi:ribose/xylose/arabinose/galactoside ABC-type transport system permease subunit|nr:ABC transporter permease [Vicinamibacterales bacterium]
MHRREISLLIVIVALGLVLGAIAPGYFARENLSDLFLGNMPVLIVAIGTTLVILTGNIDISVGSVFAICGIVAGVAAKGTDSVAFAALVSCTVGGMLGALNGSLVAYLRMPSIVVTLATMVALRDALRWVTEGAWVQNLPAGFQWFGLPQSSYPFVACAIVIVLLGTSAWVMSNIAVGRAVYATGSNETAARLAGLDTARIKFMVFIVAGALTGLAALLNSVRFNQIPSNAGIGLEMKVIAAAVVGGAAIRGGSGSLVGTLLGVVLLGAIGPALTFLGVSAYWERALQGAIILAAVAVDAVRERRAVHSAVATAGAA